MKRFLFEAEAGVLAGGAQEVSLSGASGGKAVRFTQNTSSVVLTVDIPSSGNYYAYLRYSRDERYENVSDSSLIPDKFAYIRPNNGKASRFVTDICSPDQFIMATANSPENVRLSLVAGKNTLTVWGDSNIIVDALILELRE